MCITHLVSKVNSEKIFGPGWLAYVWLAQKISLFTTLLNTDGDEYMIWPMRFRDTSFESCDHLVCLLY